MSTLPRPILVLVLATLVAVGAACSSGDDDAGGDTAVEADGTDGGGDEAGGLSGGAGDAEGTDGGGGASDVGGSGGATVDSDGDGVPDAPADADPDDGIGGSGGSSGSDSGSEGGSDDSSGSDGGEAGGGSDGESDGTSGGDAPGDDPSVDGGPGGGAATTAPATTAPPTTEAPAAAPIVLALNSQRCSGRPILSITASAGRGQQANLRSVTIERQNEFGAWLPSTARWLGPETGAGDQWTGEAVTGQRFGTTLRITARSNDGQTQTITAPVTGSC